MKHFNRRAISVALLITLGAAFSVNASATESASIEKSLSEMVMLQGEKVMSDLTVQLQESIMEEVNRFSASFYFDESIEKSIAWLTEEEITKNEQQVSQLKKL
ncbi:hypothetical protein Q4530_05515 [Colwellia sp. 1_MG-2023]|jgi:hypothetical protein|uniref:hypothetical protein n=1 Tax=unclassified Colwellia TaxID=196834 RepID=UPI001C090763|nr:MULTISPECIES: hypothetical protein [unclassified Colwellia]MBU2924066.1 hypothetical protein [Colwellia sp. C2M11]MDO6651956.1 hypothetical protein [Colwellia sp. 3_MG-2023]MDO6664732.1 hypothetical protein [Colwellia sp. 2_MG-2023]MDO6689226.1 hypothetical protein [Colwellia sp. 1_MG-2023]